MTPTNPNRMKKGMSLMSIRSEARSVRDRMTRSTEDAITPRAVTRTTGSISYL